MVGVKGIGGIPEPTPERPANVRDRKRDEVQRSSQDDVQISSKAQEAAGVARLVRMASDEPEVRPERVAAAKDNIERGDYKQRGVVVEVARRISRLLGL